MSTNDVTDSIVIFILADYATNNAFGKDATNTSESVVLTFRDAPHRFKILTGSFEERDDTVLYVHRRCYQCFIHGGGGLISRFKKRREN